MTNNRSSVKHARPRRCNGLFLPATTGSPAPCAGRRRSPRHRPGPGVQQFGEVAGLVVLDVDLEMVQEAPAVFGDAEKMDPGAVGAAGPRESCRPRPRPVTGPGPALVPAGRCAGRGNRTRWLGAARRGAGGGRGRAGPGSGLAGPDGPGPPDRLLIRCPVPARDRVPPSAPPGQVCLAGPLDPLPDRGEPVVPGSGERADRDRDQAGQRADPPLRRPQVRQRFQALPRTSGQILAVRTRLDVVRSHARQCHCGHAIRRSRRPQRPT